MTANLFSMAARLADGTVLAWGNNDFGQLGNGTMDIRAVPTPVVARVTGAVTAVHAEGETAHKAVGLRVPNHGIQPQVAVDAEGTVHLLYFKGDPGAGDVFYARSKDGEHFHHPIRPQRETDHARTA